MKYFYPVLNQNKPKFTETDKKSIKFLNFILVFNQNEKIKDNYYKIISLGCNYCDLIYSKESISVMPKKKLNKSNLTIEIIKERIEILNQMIKSVIDIYEDEKTVDILEEYVSECIFIIIYI